MTTILLALAWAPFAHDIEPRAVDLGTIKAGAPLTRSFRIINNSDSILELKTAKVSCGCSQWNFSADRVKPKDIAAFNVTINTLAQPAGPWQWSATIETNRGPEVVTLRGALVREITLTPPALAFSLERGTLSQTIEISDTRTKPLTITAVASSAKFISATLKGSKIDVTLAEDAPVGEHRETITLVTNDATYPELRVPVTVVKTAAAALKAYPSELTFDDGDTETVLLKRPDGAAFEIANASATDAYKVTWSKGSSITHRVRIQRLRDMKAELTITTSAGDSVRIVVIK